MMAARQYHQLLTGTSSEMFHYTDLNSKLTLRGWRVNEKTTMKRQRMSKITKHNFRVNLCLAAGRSRSCFWQRRSNPPTSAINKQLVYHWAVSSSVSEQTGQNMSATVTFWVNGFIKPIWSVTCGSPFLQVKKKDCGKNLIKYFILFIL